MIVHRRRIWGVNATTLSADVHEKFLEQEKARLLEQAQLDKDNEDIDLVGRELVRSRQLCYNLLYCCDGDVKNIF